MNTLMPRNGEAFAAFHECCPSFPAIFFSQQPCVFALLLKERKSPWFSSTSSCMGWVDRNTPMWLARPLEEAHFGKGISVSFSRLVPQGEITAAYVPGLEGGLCWVLWPEGSSRAGGPAGWHASQPQLGWPAALLGVWRQSDHDAAALHWEARRCPSGTPGSHHVEKAEGCHAIGFGGIFFESFWWVSSLFSPVVFQSGRHYCLDLVYQEPSPPSSFSHL